MAKLDKFQGMLDNNLGELENYDDHYISGLVGGNKPSTYSKSPQMWNDLFREIGIKATYFPFDYNPEKNIEELLDAAIEHGKFINFNVTDPFKAVLYEALKKGSESGKYKVKFSFEANYLGAVNHVLFDENRGLHALNTDGAGLVRSIIEVVYDIAEKNIVLIGAGGAARSIAYNIMKSESHLTILNRTVEKAEKLAELLNSMKKDGSKGNMVAYGGITEGEIKKYASDADIIMQAITRGLPVNENIAKEIRKEIMFVDIRYGDKAEFAKLGEDTGHPSLDGKGMVFWQFVIAAEKLGEIRPEFKIHGEYFNKCSEDCLK